MRAKHIAVFLPSMAGGGAEKVILNLVNEWVLKEYRVDLVLVRAYGVYLHELSPDVNVVDLNAKRTVTSIWPLVKYLRKSRPDTILSAMDHANIAAICASLISTTNVKVAVSVHCVHDAYRKVGSWPSRVLPLIARLFYRLADFRIAVSKGVADDIAASYWFSPVKFNKIYNPVDNAKNRTLENDTVLHKWFELESTPVIVAVGRLHEVKDYPTLLKAFSIIRRRYDARLIILGEGEKREELEALSVELGVALDVDMCGHVKNPSCYMARASVFVMSSIYEGFGNVLVEAMACGTPVVSTDCPYGPREILKDGKFGKLVPVGNAKLMANAIIDVLRDRPCSDKLKIRAAEFSVEKVAKEYLDLIMAN